MAVSKKKKTNRVRRRRPLLQIRRSPPFPPPPDATPDVKEQHQREQQQHMVVVKSLLLLMLQQEQKQQSSCSAVYTLSEFLQTFVPMLPTLDVLLRSKLGLSLLHNNAVDNNNDDDNNNHDNHNNSSKNSDATELSLLLRYTLLVPNHTRASTVRQEPNVSKDRRRPNGKNDVRCASSSSSSSNVSSAASSAALAPLSKLQLPPTQSQSLESLIQDCIWTLLHQQHQQQPHSLRSSRSNRQTRTTPRNVLCLGYELATEYSTASSVGTSTATGTTNTTGPTSLWRQRQLNAGVEYCQRHSPLFPVLHSILGDDILRFILLHASIFVPIVQPLSPEGGGLGGKTTSSIPPTRSCCTQPTTNGSQLTTTGNYWQVVGPSLRLEDASSSLSLSKWLGSPVAATSLVSSKRLRTSNDNNDVAPLQPVGGRDRETYDNVDTTCANKIRQSDVNHPTKRVPLAPRENAMVVNRRRKRHRARPMRILLPPVTAPTPPSAAIAALAPLSCLRRQSLFHSCTYTATVGQGLLLTANGNSTHHSPKSSALSSSDPADANAVTKCAAGDHDAGTTTVSSLRATVSPQHPTSLAETLWHSMIDEYVRHQSSLECSAKQPSTLSAYSTTTVPPLSSAGVTTCSSHMSTQLCLQIRQRHQRTNYHRLLRRHCPLPDKYKSMSLDQLAVNGYSTTDQVIAFVQSCVKAVIPSSFWYGSSKLSVCRKRKSPDVACGYSEQRLSNESVFVQQTIPVFVSLRRNEQMTNSMLMQNLRISNMPWLASSTQRTMGALSPRIHHELDKLLVLSILRWLFHSYIIPLLQQVFYVTECEFHRRRIMFYRKPVWALFRTLSMEKVLGGPSDKTARKTAQYQELKESDAAERLRVQRLGLSRLRLVPKSTGVRPIAMLSRRESLWFDARQESKNENRSNDGDKCDVDEKHLKPKGSCTQLSSQLARRSKIRVPEQSRLPTNILLRDVFAVLSYEYSRNENLCGYGLMGMHHFYTRYRAFLLEWKDSACSPSLLPKRKRSQLYFGSVDIRHCYDNINQNHLMGVIDTVLTNESYVIQKYSVAHATDGARRAQLLRKREVGMPDQFGSFSEKVQALANVYHGSVFVDDVNFFNLSKLQIMDQLHEHLSGNMVATKGRFGNRYLLQTKGIPQGSILSTLLCNFYYGDIEHRLLNSVTSLNSDAVQCQLVARMVDDFIFVTTDVNALKDFFTTMHRGDTVRGVEINHDKTNTSIDMSISRGSVESNAAMIELKTNEASGSFSWCGMLFDTTSGDVRIDYSRFFEVVGDDGLPTVERICLQVGQLAGQMQRFVRPRCISILFDPCINSYATQAINYYQLIAYAAVKTAEYLFSCGNKVTSQSPVLSNPEYVVRCMQTTIEYSFIMIQSHLIKSYQSNPAKNGQSNSAKKGRHCIDRRRLRVDVAAWLGWRAFFDVFQDVPRSDFNQLAIHHVACMMTRPIDIMTENDSLCLEAIVASGRESMNICSMIETLILGTNAPVA